MLNNDQLRPLLMALYGLVAMVALMLVTVAALAWYMPTGTSQPVAMAGGTGSAPGAAPAPVAKVMSADAVAGKELFTNNCSACHSTGAEKVVGPGLAGIRQRTPGEAWLQKWIRNSSALIASGDAYATKVFNENGKIQMTSYTNFTDQQIKQVLDYVDSQN